MPHPVIAKMLSDIEADIAAKDEIITHYLRRKAELEERLVMLREIDNAMAAYDSTEPQPVEVDPLAPSKQLIINALQQGGFQKTRELAIRLHKPPNSVSGELSKLKRMGLILHNQENATWGLAP